MWKRARSFACLSLLALGPACAVDTGEPVVGGTAAPVVYGDDDRREVYEHPSEMLKNIARQSVAALVPQAAVDMHDPGHVALAASTLADDAYWYNDVPLCPGERYATQPTAAFCSATLIAPDLVLTAGHCAPREEDCANTSIVFDYHYEDEDTLAAMTSDAIYRCTERLGYSFRHDTVVLRLDRPVGAGRKPIAMHPAYFSLAEGATVSMIGFGSGLPAKIDSGGVVLKSLEGSHQRRFLTTLDAFGGNSGSGVFDDEGRLVGVLTEGLEDYVVRDGCVEVNRVARPNVSDGDGENVMYAWSAMYEVCEDDANMDLAFCADPKGWCPTCKSGSGGGRCAVSPGTHEDAPLMPLALLGLGVAIVVRRTRRP